PNKGHIFGDKDWFGFWDKIDDAIENPPKHETKQETVMRTRQGETSRLVWECHQCGRLYLEDQDHNLVEYRPANRKYNAILTR
ncbi:MAG: hypothetical protein V7703_14105, partial [Hyphomicrobiales bacterium]